MKNTNLKRVLQITGSMNRGGAETMIMNIYRKIDKEKIQFDFVVYSEKTEDFEQEILELGGRILRVPSPKKSGVLKYFKNFKQLITNNGPYVAVHAHTLFNSGIPLFCAKIIGIPVRVGHAHSTSSFKKKSLKNKFYSKFMRKIINFSATDKLACGIDAGKNLYGDEFITDGIVLPNAINPKEFIIPEESTIQILKKNLGLSEDIIIGHVGSFREAKNHKFMLKIAKEMKNQKLKFQMVFVGHGPLYEEVKEEAKKANLKEEIVFLGLRDDVNILLRTFDVLLMPSLYEGFPVTLVESQFSRVKAIVSDNITQDVDFDLDLIERLSLEDPINQWIKAIKDGVKSKDVISEEKVFNRLKELGFHVENSVNTLNQLYLKGNASCIEFI